MIEIYWLTVLGKLADIVGVGWFISTLCGIVAIVSAINVDDDLENPQKAKKWFKYTVISFIITTLGTIFIPTTKESCAIYGIGTVVDYVQNSEEAKQIPDNAIKAINSFLEDYNKDK